MKKPTTAQSQFFKSNDLTLPPSERAARSTIAFIREAEGSDYLTRTSWVRTLQETLIGLEIDGGSVIKYLSFKSLTLRASERRRWRRTSQFNIVVLDKTDKLKVIDPRCHLKNGEPIWRDEVLLPVDWERFRKFRAQIMSEIVSTTQPFLKKNRDWKFSGQSGYSEFYFRIVTDRNPRDAELQELAKALESISLPSEVQIRKLPGQKFGYRNHCEFRISVNPTLFTSK